MERKVAIERLKQLRLDYTEFWEEIKNETTEALDMAIASLETDEAYQLEYEGVQNIVITEGMTNGAVIKSMFSDGVEVVQKSAPEYTYFNGARYKSSWWNSPYKKE